MGYVVQMIRAKIALEETVNLAYLNDTGTQRHTGTVTSQELKNGVLTLGKIYPIFLKSHINVFLPLHKLI